MTSVITPIFDDILLEQNQEHWEHFKDEEWIDMENITFSKEAWKNSGKDLSITILNALGQEWDRRFVIGINLDAFQFQSNLHIISCIFLNIRLQPIWD